MVLGESPLTLERVRDVARRGARAVLGDAARERMRASRAVVDSVLSAGADAPAVYGVNTGFGALAEVRISPDQIRDVQKNLVRLSLRGDRPAAASAHRARC